MKQISWESFENYLLSKMEEENIPGVAVAISQNGKVIYEKGFGYRDIEEKAPVTPETIFGIASITKSFTALAIMKLEDEGCLSVHDPVIKHLPDFRILGIKNMEEIKIHHLLSHTTGMAPMERHEKLNKLSDHLTYFSSKEHEILGAPGEYFSYCNDTFLLLGAIIEKITGKLYRRHITEALLNPLQMYRTTMSLEEVAKYENVTVPYDHTPEKKLEKKTWPKLGNYEVGGGIRSTVKDLLKYGELYINEGIANNEKILSDSFIKKMWEQPFQILEQSFYGYAFKVTPDYSGVTIIEHGGGQPGVSSNFGFLPEKNLVVSVLCNVSNVSAQDIWLAAVNNVLGLPLTKKRFTVPKSSLSMEQVKRFVGTYDCQEGGKAVIYLEKDVPNLLMNGERFPLQGGQNNQLIISKTGAPIQFYVKDDRIWALLLGSRMLIKRD